MNLESNFIFTVCQVGAEPTLKKEILREYSNFRFAFSRPGFVTFKNLDSAINFDFTLNSIFARTYGVSFGAIQPEETSKILDLAKSLNERDPQKRLRLHIWERDLHPPGEEPIGFVPGSLLGDIEQRIRNASSDRFEKSALPHLGDWIVHVIALDPGKFSLGATLYSEFHSPWPGGRPEIHLPSDAPSRAYLKLEESILWSKAPIKTGDTAVEIGSAPGGASYALLKRGLRVVGIDPAEMSVNVLKHKEFKHIQKPIAQVPREELPQSVQWLLLDMNVEPRISLFAVDRLVSRMKDSLVGVLLTVKLNRWAIANEIPSIVEHVRAMGMVKVRVAQLGFHRQEILIYGLTRKGITRSKN